MLNVEKNKRWTKLTTNHYGPLQGLEASPSKPLKPPFSRPFEALEAPFTKHFKPLKPFQPLLQALEAPFEALEAAPSVYLQGGFKEESLEERFKGGLKGDLKGVQEVN